MNESTETVPINPTDKAKEIHKNLVSKMNKIPTEYLDSVGRSPTARTYFEGEFNEFSILDKIDGTIVDLSGEQQADLLNKMDGYLGEFGVKIDEFKSRKRREKERANKGKITLEKADKKYAENLIK